MLLRNYDVLKALCEMVDIDRTSDTGFTLNLSNTFGDGHISIKNYDGAMVTTGAMYAYKKVITHPFNSFNGCGATPESNGNINRSNLICGYNSGEVGYDDYNMDITPTGLIFVSHNVTSPSLNENNEVVSTYTKILCNSSSEDITINCVGVTYNRISKTYAGHILLYKEKIPEIIIPAGGNIVLTFTTKVPLGQNKPADYVATANVE